MGILSTKFNFWSKSKNKKKIDPELLYLRAVQRLQKQFGNISPKQMLEKEHVIQNMAEHYGFQPGETAHLLVTIFQYAPEAKEIWEEYLKRALKLAQTLGRTSCLTLSKEELKSSFARFSQ